MLFFHAKVRHHLILSSAFNLGQVLSSNTKSTIDNNSRINLFTNKYLSGILENISDVIVQDKNLSAIKEINPVEIFVDGLRIGILPPKSILNDTYLGKSLKINKNLYPLFIRKTQNSIKTNSEITYTNMNLQRIVQNTK